MTQYSRNPMLKPILMASIAAVLAGCTDMPIPAGDNASNVSDNGSPDENGAPADRVVWGDAFDTRDSGALSAVWGTAPDDVFVVGGQREQAEVYHFNGESWAKMAVPEVPILVWVFGFSQNDVYAVGEGGGIIHYDGSTWSEIESFTDEDLWGVWGASREDIWIVGGDSDGGEPVLLHFDGRTIEPVAVPENDRAATALFKVWGIGQKLFAVGSNGLIIEFADGVWQQVPTGAAANDDFVSLWGTSENNIVAVGGRSSGRIAHYDGQSWTTQLLAGVPGLNAVFMVDANQALVGGVNGYAGTFDPSANTLTAEDTGATQTIHGIWSDKMGTFYAIGGRFNEPLTGLVLARTLGEPDFDVRPPDDIQQPPPTETTLTLGVANGQPFRPLENGDDLQVFSQGQGGIHVFLSFRTTGFPSEATIDFTVSATRASDGEIAIREITQPDRLNEIAPGQHERLDRFVRITALFPSEIVGTEAIFNITLTVADDPTISASQSITVFLVPPVQ